MEKITQKDVTKVFDDNMMEFSAYALLNRALPRLEDGAKPVTRRILWAMYKANATKLTKSQTIVGQVMKYHPHGSTYDTIVSLAQVDGQNTPFLEGKGNFGSHSSRDLQYAADRYTEIKLKEIALDMLDDVNKDVVKMCDNYDGTYKIPEVLPTKFPSILTQSQSGIGVGYSSNIPSFNLKELVDAVINYIKKGKTTLLAPDFATGGSIIKDEEVLKQINTKGSGTVTLRGRAKIIKNEISVTEIPYTTTREAIIEKVEQLYAGGKLKEVSDIKDLTGLKGMEISITAKRNVNMEALLEKLYRLTPLESKFSSNINLLYKGYPQVMGVWPIIKEWLQWRTGIVKLKIENDIKKKEYELHLINGFLKIIDNLNDVIDTIRFSKADNIISSLCFKYNLDEIQATEMADLKLKNLNREKIEIRTKKKQTLEESIKKQVRILMDENRLHDIIIEELNSIKNKFGVERKTKLMGVNEIKDIFDGNQEQEIKDYDTYISVTIEGYVYKHVDPNIDLKLKPGDKVKWTIKTRNKENLLIFDEEKQLHKYAINNIDLAKRSSFGLFIKNEIKKLNTNIVGIAATDSKNLLFVYKNTNIAKVSIESFKSSRETISKAYSDKVGLLEIKGVKSEKEINIIFDNNKEKIVDIDSLREASSRTTLGACTRKDRLIKQIKYNY